jgi:hypothetical protein
MAATETAAAETAAGGGGDDSGRGGNKCGGSGNNEKMKVCESSNVPRRHKKIYLCIRKLLFAPK